MIIKVGEKIKELRKKKGLTQEEMAEFLHISQSTYARIEAGETISWANYIDPLCEYFKIHPEDLLKQDPISGDQVQQVGENTFIVNQLSEKLIEQYVIRLKEKDILIRALQEQIRTLQHKL